MAANSRAGFFKAPGFFAGQPYDPAKYGEDIWDEPTGDAAGKRPTVKVAVPVVHRPRVQRAPANTRGEVPAPRSSVKARAMANVQRHPGTVLVLGVALGTLAHMLVPLWTPGFLLGVVAAAVWRVAGR